MHRFFVPKDQLPVITGSDAHQIKNVLRLKPGDKVELLDGSGTVYLSKISDICKDKIVCDIIDAQRPATGDLPAGRHGRRQVTIAQCLPKAKKMDLIVQKCTELGAAGIIPTLSERSVAKGEKLARWQKIAKESAEQSGRTTIPEVTPLTKFKDVLKLKNNYDLALIPWELEKEHTLKSILSNSSLVPHPSSIVPRPSSIIFIIGPEGGFSQQEIGLARRAGFTPITLGPRILRAETAGPAILSMVNYHFDQ